ncbi:MAG TPA: hypothetical protein VFY00_06540 [Arenimonas sp.]|nr:hypothetical protein [Arenimonas sp.]
MSGTHHRFERMLTTAIGATLLAITAGCAPADEQDAATAQAAQARSETATQPSAAPALATSRATLGTITTRVDGRSTTWETVDGVAGDELRRASASFARQGPMVLLSLQGLMPGEVSGQMSISAVLMKQGDDYQAMDEAELSMFPEGASGPRLEVVDLDVQWDRLEIGETDGHVKGSFSGSLCPMDSATDIAEGCTPIEGEFDSQVRHDGVLQEALNP